MFRFCIRPGWVSLAYLLMKFMFIINIVLQIVILHIFLGFSWGDLFSEHFMRTLGWKIATYLGLRLNFKSDWMSTGLFPRSTMCDFDVSIKVFSIRIISTPTLHDFRSETREIFNVILFSKTSSPIFRFHKTISDACSR